MSSVVENERPEDRLATQLEIRAREIAREEVASLVGLVLGRLHSDPQAPLAQKLASAFSEALRDFGGTKDEPGPRAA